MPHGPRNLHATIEALWRIESPRLIARLARLTRDVGTAEELAQDALVAALEQWPQQGLPDNPGAWLMATPAPAMPPTPIGPASPPSTPNSPD